MQQNELLVLVWWCDCCFVCVCYVCDIIGRYVLLIGGSLNPYCSGKLNHFNHRFLPLFYAHEDETATFTKTGSGQTDGNLKKRGWFAHNCPRRCIWVVGYL